MAPTKQVFWSKTMMEAVPKRWPAFFMGSKSISRSRYLSGMKGVEAPPGITALSARPGGMPPAWSRISRSGVPMGSS